MSLYRSISRNPSTASRAPKLSASAITSDEHEIQNIERTPTLEGNFELVSSRSYDNHIFCGDAHSSFSALGFSDGSIKISNVNGERSETSLCPLRDEDPKLPVTSIHFLANSSDPSLLLASYASGYTTLWDLKKRQELWDLKEDRQTLVNALSPSMHHFALAGSDANINVYDLETQQLVSTFKRGTDENIHDGHVMRIFALKFSPGNHTEMVSGGWDNTVQIWDVRQQRSVRRISGQHICGDGIDFMQKGHTLITAAWTRDKPLKSWDFRSCKHVQDFKLDDIVSYLYCCRYSQSGNFIITAGAKTNMVCIYDRTTQSIIASYKYLADGVYYVHDIPYSSEKDRKNKFKVYIAFGKVFCHLTLSL